MTQVGSCNTCHEARYPGIDGEPLVVSQAHATLAGAQMHPVARDRCAECHVLYPTERIESVVAVTATVKKDVRRHPDGLPAGGCAECHWVLDGLEGTPVKSEERRVFASDTTIYGGPR